MFKKSISAVAVVMLAALTLLSASTRPTSRDLYNKYVWYNHKYFNNELPNDVIILYDRRVEEKKLWAQTSCSVEKGKVSSTRMSPRLQELELANIESLYLLHESVHIKLCGIEIGHGPKFKAEMRRLAAEGAMDDLW